MAITIITIQSSTVITIAEITLIYKYQSYNHPQLSVMAVIWGLALPLLLVIAAAISNFIIR